jgi:tryptophan-rich hypothetical protein
MAWFPAKAWTSQRAVGGYRHFQLVTQGGKGETTLGRVIGCS